MSRDLVYRFGHFELDPETGDFRRDGVSVPLQEKPFQLLALLLEHGPEVVSRAQMRERLWPADTFVDFDRNLNAAARKLRRALEDSADAPRFIETFPRRGYRFIAPVEIVPRNVRPAGKVPAVKGPALLGVLHKQRPFVSRALLLLVVGAALLTTSFYPAGMSSAGAADCPPRFTLAVLPFQEHPQGKNHQHVGDALSDLLTVRLAAWNPGRLGVLSRRAVEKYRCTTKTIAEIGAELGVTFVVDGTVRPQGNRLVVTAEFIQVSDQTQIWSHTFEVPANDLPAMQEALTQGVLQAVAGCLLPNRNQEVAARFPGEYGRP